MLASFLKKFRGVDWLMFSFIFALLSAGLITMKSFGESPDYFFTRQLIWIFLGLAVFFIFQSFNWSFLENSFLASVFYLTGLLILVFLLIFSSGKTASWLELPLFSFQPAEPMKIITILILAKYLATRHIEISQFKHIIISGLYAFFPFALVFFQPDFGSAIIFFFIWLGFMISSGISKKHFFFIFLAVSVIFFLSWNFLLFPYQKDRLSSFLNPYLDQEGRGYHQTQSIIAIGSGGLLGKGIGEGSQTRLKFLPEYQTDFVFAALSEEWGFSGATLVLIFYLLIIWRILILSREGKSNFARLYGFGFSFFLMAHIFAHIGANVGLLPITGVPLPFLSYGGSHLLTVFAGLGILESMKKEKSLKREDAILI